MNYPPQTLTSLLDALATEDAAHAIEDQWARNYPTSYNPTTCVLVEPENN